MDINIKISIKPFGQTEELYSLPKVKMYPQEKLIRSAHTGIRIFSGEDRIEVIP